MALPICPPAVTSHRRTPPLVGAGDKDVAVAAEVDVARHPVGHRLADRDPSLPFHRFDVPRSLPVTAKRTVRAEPGERDQARMRHRFADR